MLFDLQGNFSFTHVFTQKSFAFFDDRRPDSLQILGSLIFLYSFGKVSKIETFVAQFEEQIFVVGCLPTVLVLCPPPSLNLSTL